MLVNYRNPVFRLAMKELCGEEHATLQREADCVEGIVFDEKALNVYYRNGMNILEVSTIRGCPHDVFDLGVFRNLKFLKVGQSWPTGKYYLHKVSDALESLSFDNCNMGDLKQLTRFPKLKYLEIRDNYNNGGSLLDTVPMEVRSKIHTLRIESLTSIKGLQGYCALRELLIRRTGGNVCDKENMPLFEKLEKLIVSGFNWMYRPEENLFPALEYLDAKRTPGICLEALKQFEHLQYLNLSECSLYDISALEGIPLKVLDLYGNMIEDITPLSRNKALELLTIDSNPLVDISPVERMEALQALHLRDTWVEDISPLMKLDHLKEVSLDHKTLRDKSQLEELKRKQGITVNDCQ